MREEDKSEATQPAAPAREILSYLLERPRAQDTLEGIAQWWLLEHYVQQRVAQVRQALQQLVERDFIQLRKMPDSSLRYRINRGKLAEIEAFLKKNA